MSGLTRETRLQIMLTDNELTTVDDWRFKHRLPSRASAVRELLRRGLAAEALAVGGKTRSVDIGVLDAAPADGQKRRGNGATKTG